MAEKKPPEAPWRYVVHMVNVEGKNYMVRYLGKDGREMLENAQCKTRCWHARDQFEKDIKELKSMLKEAKAMLNVLTDIIGGPNAMVEYFKSHVLVQLDDKSCRTGDLIFKPYSDFKQTALQELLKEDKIVHTRNGWWKLGRI